MTLIASDNPSLIPHLARMLEGFDCPAILVSEDYQILAFNTPYQNAFGKIEITQHPRCYEVSHGYQKPCDQAGEDCPLTAAKHSKHKERVLHIHHTPRGKEHVDVEMLPIFDDDGTLKWFVELLRPVPLASGSTSPHEMVGSSEAFNDMLQQITRVGRSDASVLLLGESGTGKELAAYAIHLASSRKDKSMVTLECAGLSDALFESELFGHVKGAFTGAHNHKKGLAALANNGTLFLDEIGDVPLSMQVKLLRLLETGTYRMLGSTETQSSNFRLICATHKNLLAMVEAETFRQDLYFRINVFPIRVPSLEQRKTDIAIIAKTLLDKLSPQNDYHLMSSSIKLLTDYHYTGHIRELRNILNRAIVLTDTNIIDDGVIKKCLQVDNQTSAHKKDIKTDIDLKTLETQYLQSLLDKYNDKEKVAEIAGISVRSLYRKLNTKQP